MGNPQAVRILLIGGSLRSTSGNSAVLQTLSDLASGNVETAIDRTMGALPHFNPDDDREPLPEAVAALRDSLRWADGVMFSTPEYAGTLPGTFKNLLDWTIGGVDGGSLYGVPVGWINPSTHGGSDGAYQTLRTVVTMAGGVIVDEACCKRPVPRDGYGEDGIIANPAIREDLGNALAALVRYIESHPKRGS